MKNDARFEPVFARHSIERCAFSINFDQPLPQKLFQKILSGATVSLAHAGLNRTAAAGTSFTIDISSGRVVPTSDQTEHGVFTSPDGDILNLTPVSISWMTNQYTRWAPFKGQCADYIGPLVEAFADVISIAAIKLEYWDRFVWRKDGLPANLDALIRMESGLIAYAAVKEQTLWHSHCGWFEQSESSARRLINVNIDATPFVDQPGQVARPSIGIFTMAQEQYITPDLPPVSVDAHIIFDQAQNLHEALKALFGSTISDEMANRISLWGGE